MKRFLLILFTLLICVAVGTAKKAKKQQPNRSSDKVRQEQRDTRRQIERTQSRVNENSRQTRQGLDKLSTIEADIAVRQEAINRMQVSIDDLNSRIKVLSDSVADIESDIIRLKDDYAESLRAMRRQRQTLNSLNFVFASTTFEQAQRRLRYLGQIGEWRKSKSKKLKDAMAQLQQRREQLEATRQQLAERQADLLLAKQQLDRRHNEAAAVVADLRRQGRTLTTELRKQQQRLNELNAELDRAVAAEVRRAEEERRRQQQRQQEQQRQQQQSPGSGKPTKPVAQGESGYAAEERRLTGNFESNKGKLLFPVAGKYTIVSAYGLHTRPGTNVPERNNGIDISTGAGAAVRAVFSGEVVSVFRVKGTGYYAVLIRHGKYITVYSKLANYSVSNGQKVQTGQTIGTVFHDPEQNDNRLHFEIRHESTTLNPLEWIK